MRVTFVCPSGDKPIGGVTALYEFANGLARRGHEIHMVHLPMWGRRVESLDDLGRYRFDDAVRHYLPGADPATLPDTDLVFGTGAPERLGLPVLLVQGFEMLHTHLEEQAFRTPCLKVCVAGWLVDVGRTLGVPPEQLCVVPMGIDHDRFCATTPFDDRPPRVTLLYSSHPAKGWEVGLRALHAVRGRVPDLQVAAFGTDVPDTPLPSWLTFHHDPPLDRLVELYDHSQVFLQTSDYEGFGFTAVEAMSCGCALVTTDNGGSRDYARPGETALVADPGDAGGLADHVVGLLEDRDRRRHLVDAGRREVRRFDWDLGAELLEGHLERYLADPDHFLQPPAPAPDTGDDEVQGALAARILEATRTR